MPGSEVNEYTMYRIAICEDEPLMAQENEAAVCRILEDRHLRRDTDFIVAGFSSAETLLAALREQPFHLLLLDIRLARENGLELAAHLRACMADCSIIYVTSYAEYMPDSFATRPLDYLMKPLDEKKLAKAIDWDLRKNYRPRQITLPVNGGRRRVELRDILYAEATSHKSAVCLTEGMFFVNLPFRELIPRLHADSFCRCHNSYMVNLARVRKKTAQGLLMDNGTEIPVSRTYQKELARQFVAFME